MASLLIKHFIFTVIFFTFLGAAVWMPFSMTGNMEHHQNMMMTDCPFMLGEGAICTMPLFEYLASWQAIMTLLPPEIVLLTLLLFATYCWFSRFLNNSPGTRWRRTLESFKAFKVSPFTLFFLRNTISPRAP